MKSNCTKAKINEQIKTNNEKNDINKKKKRSKVKYCYSTVQYSTVNPDQSQHHTSHEIEETAYISHCIDTRIMELAQMSSLSYYDSIQSPVN